MIRLVRRLRNLFVISAAWHRPDQRYEREVDITHFVHYSLDEHASMAGEAFRGCGHTYTPDWMKIFFHQCATCGYVSTGDLVLMGDQLLLRPIRPATANGVPEDSLRLYRCGVSHHPLHRDAK